MPPELKIFAAQFVVIWMLGLQSINVNRGHYVLAALTSFGLGIVGFYVTGVVAMVFQNGMLNTMFISFIVAGPCGIVTSMWTHKHISRFLKRDTWHA